MPAITALPAYPEFGRLRLRPFCPRDALYQMETVEITRGHVFWEAINHVVFQSWSEFPGETARISIGFQGFASNGLPMTQTIAPAILEALGLELEAGLSHQETVSRLGTPPLWQSKFGRFAVFHLGEESIYEINCGFMTPDQKLDRVLIERLDIKIPPEK